MSSGKCFVISPIGKEGSDTRKHADQVFHYVLKDAAASNDLEPVRGDMTADGTRAMDSIVRRILQDQLIIADITDLNPNVLYELGVAHSAAKPVILLSRVGQEIPFDFKDFPRVEYDLAGGVEGIDKAKQTLTRLIQDTLARQVLYPPWGGNLAPLGAQVRDVEIVEDRNLLYSTALPQILKTAKKRLDLMSISMSSLWKLSEFQVAMNRVLKDGRVRIVLMDPANPALGQLVHDLAGDDLEEIRSQITRNYAKFKEHGVDGNRVEVRLAKRGLVTSSLILTEREAAATEYFYSKVSEECPTIIAKSPTKLYDAYRVEFETLWDQNAAPAEAANVRALKPAGG